MKIRTARALALAVAVPLGLTMAACSADNPGGGGGDSKGGTIEYWLWDSNQQPAYQKCADAFTAANPGIQVQWVTARLNYRFGG